MTTKEKTRIIEAVKKLGFNFEGNSLKQLLSKINEEIKLLPVEEQTNLSQDVLEQIIGSAANSVQHDLDLENEILIEDRFPAENMSPALRNKCLWLIYNSKEVESSPFAEDPLEPFELVQMHMKKIGISVEFNGAISNGQEVKMIDGIIRKEPQGIHHISMNVYRLFEYLDDDDRMYYLDEYFTLGEDTTTRETRYSNLQCFSDELQPRTDRETKRFMNGLALNLRQKYKQNS